MSRQRKEIISLLNTNKTLYVVGDPPINDAWVTREGFVVEGIEAKRDGNTGLYKGHDEEAHYVVTLVNEVSDKIKMFDIIPIKEMARITFVISEMPEEGNQVSVTQD